MGPAKRDNSMSSPITGSTMLPGRCPSLHDETNRKLQFFIAKEQKTMMMLLLVAVLYRVDNGWMVLPAAMGLMQLVRRCRRVADGVGRDASQSALEKKQTDVVASNDKCRW
jgi:hypothetical protein